jgi:hypothetical protein
MILQHSQLGLRADVSVAPYSKKSAYVRYFAHMPFIAKKHLKIIKTSSILAVF